MVQWRAPSISSVNYTVTVTPPSPNCSAETESYNKSDDEYFLNISIPSIPCYNVIYVVNVTGINYCGLSSVPTTVNVSVEARGKFNQYHGVVKYLL